MNDTSLDRQPADIEYVPAGWNLRRLAEISTSIGDGIHSTPNYVEHSRFSFINGNNLVDGSICIFGSTKFVGEDEYMRLRINLSSQTILISINGTIGNLALFQGEEVVLGKSAAYVNLKKGISREFVYYYLASRRVSSFFENELTGTTIRNLSLQTLRNTPILLPSSTQEGNQIASALGDVEDLIFTLERLIAKQQAIKQGLMQQLLTGNTRLPGFGRDWHVVLLGDIARIKTGSRNNQDKKSSGQYPFFVRSATVERIDSYSYDCEAVLIPGEGGIGSIFHYINGKFEVHQRVYKISHFASEALGKFVYYYMQQFFGRHAMDNSVKATVDSLRLPTFQNFSMNIPRELAEQQAIVQSLDDISSEVVCLERLLAKAKAIKQGMMRELLTGRTRLPVKEAVS